MHSIKDVGRGGGNNREREVDSVEIKKGVDSLASKYSGKSEEELMGLLMQSVSAARANGSFSEETLDEFVGFVSPELDERTRSRLVSLVNMIKNS